MAEGQGRSSGQGVKLLYIRDYLHKHTNKEHPKSAREISEYLASKGIKADRKTIYNDILRLQTDFQEPIAYNPMKWGYYISEPTFSLYELQVLLDSVQAADFLSAKEVSTISKKIAGLTNVYDQKELAAIPAFDDTSARPVVSELEKVAIIKQAIRENKKISFRRFTYQPTDSNRANHGKTYIESYAGNEVHIVSPKVILQGYGNHVLRCFRDDARMVLDEDFVYFLKEIEDIVILPSERNCIDIEEPEKPEHISLYEYASETFLEKDFMDGVLGGTEAHCDKSEEKYDWIRDILIAHEEYWVRFILSHMPTDKVTLSFKKENASCILKEFGYDVVLVPTARGYCTVTLDVKLTMHFFEWLTSMRDAVRVIAPFEIKELFKKYAGNLVKQYEYWDMSHGELLQKFVEMLRKEVKDEVILDQLKDFDVEIIKFENPFELVFQIMDKRKVSMEKAVEYLKEGFAKNQDDSVKPLKNFIDYLSSLLQDQPDDVLPVDQHKEVEANGQTLTLLEFLDGLPVMPELSVEEYLKETFEYLGHCESLEEILDQVGQELGVSTEEALAQLREAYETAEKEDKPLRLLNR